AMLAVPRTAGNSIVCALTGVTTGVGAGRLRLALDTVLLCGLEFRQIGQIGMELVPRMVGPK
ncbi:MAG: hypothetical protein ACE5LF_08950, partial [Alphaproteobacteria bacterium]